MTIPNLIHMLEAYGIRVRYNVIQKRLDINFPGLSASPENYLDIAISQIISLTTLNGLGSANLGPFVSTIADRNRFNPVANWINSKPWDGVDRLPALYTTVREAEDYPVEVKENLIYRWLLSAVAAATLATGFRSRGVLTLQGPQSIGKTSWFRALISDPILRAQVIKTDHHLDAGNKDSLITAIGHWFVELGELDSSFKKDVARLKGFITADFDKVRRPYARGDSEYPRRTVFCASVNAEQFLVDDSGNSRWWTIQVAQLEFKHNIDMQQVYAQLQIDLKAPSARWWLSPEEEQQLNILNKRHQAANVVSDLISSGMSPDLHKERWTFMSAIEVLRQLGLRSPSNRQCKEATSVLTELYGARRKRRGKQGWEVPLPGAESGFTQVIAPNDDDY
jgi:putative DNA primase/helicase